MTGRTYRNHPSVILSGLLTLALIIAVMAISFAPNIEEDPEVFREMMGELLTMLGTMAVLVTAILVLRWYRTTITFSDEEMSVSRATLYRMDRRIQYSKLASVNINRSVIDLLFGTSTLMFNINSSVNVARAEVTLRLRKAEAEDLREELYERIFRRTDDEGVPDETVPEQVPESLVEVTPKDIILHSILSQPSLGNIFGLVMLVSSIVSAMAGGLGAFLTSALMFAISSLLPWVRQFLRAFNYSIRRDGDTITVDNGLITKYHTSFNVGKVNSVRIRQPLLARIFGMGVLEAEVVGMIDASTNGTPLLCPLKPMAEIEELMSRLLPEFDCEMETSRQSTYALRSMSVSAALVCIVSIAVGVAVYTAPSEHGFWISVLAALLCAAFPVIVVAYVFGRQRTRDIGVGTDLFRFTIGGFDRTVEILSYDKVQIATVGSGPVQRMFGMSTCQVSMLSSVGYRTVSSGQFRPEELERIPREVMARIEDGRYDYRRYC